METALKAIAEPNRRHILELIAETELTAGQISEHFDVTRPAISQHLTVLKLAGLVSERREGTRRLYQARRQGFAEAKLFLESLWDDRLGRLRREAERRSSGTGVITERFSVQREVLVVAPLDTVWELLTDGEQMSRWMGQSATFDPSPGGSYRIEIVPGQVVAGEYVDIHPQRRLAFTWGWEGDAGMSVPPGSTIVVFDLLPTVSGTLLRLTHQDLPAIGSAGSHSRGWEHYLERLAAVAAGGAPGPDPWAIDPERLMTELRP